MLYDEIKQYIVEYIEKKGKLPKDADIDNFNYVLTGYIDSLALFKFIIVLEDNFGIRIDDNEITSPEFKTIGGLANIILGKINKK